MKLYSKFTLPENRRHEAGFRPWLQFRNSNDSFEVLRWGKKIGSLVNTNATEFKSMGTNDSCYILGSGPSVNDLPLAQLKGHPIIAVNGTSLLLAQHKLQALAYMVTDSSFLRHREALFIKGYEHAHYLAITPFVLRHTIRRNLPIFNKTQVILFERVNMQLGHPSLLDVHGLYLKAHQDERYILLPQQNSILDGTLGFSTVLEAGVFSGMTVVASALQLAYAMGFRRIYLLGVDMKVEQGTRFYESANQALTSHLERDYEQVIGPFFKIVSRMRKSHAFEVFNLSTNSRIPDSVIPRISFEQALLD